MDGRSRVAVAAFSHPTPLTMVLIWLPQSALKLFWG